MARFLRLLLLPVGLAVLTACNTIQGAGRDVEAAGEGLQNASEEVEEEISD